MESVSSFVALLSPDLADAIEAGNANPNAWISRDGKLVHAVSGKKLYQSDVADRDIETQAIRDWLAGPPTSVKPFNADTITQVLQAFNDQWESLHIERLGDLTFAEIYDSGEDFQYLCAAAQLSKTLSSGTLSLSDSNANTEKGTLCLHGICELDLLADLAGLLKPRMILVFESDLDLLAYRCTQSSQAKRLLDSLMDASTSLIFITDSISQAACVKAEAVVTTAGILPFANIFSLTIRTQPVTKDVDTCIFNPDAFLKTIRLLGFFTDELNMLANGILNFCHNNARVLSFPLIKESERHAVVAASGPSLANALPLIKRHRHSFDIISGFSTLWPLINADIYPDYHVQLERHTVHPTLLEYPHIVEACKDITLIGNPNVDPLMPCLYKNFYMFFRSASAPSALFAEHISELISGEGGEVASACIVSAILLGYKTIHLFGVDLGSSTPDVNNTRVATAPGLNERIFEIQVPGNLRPIAWSSRPMLELKEWIELILSGGFQPGSIQSRKLTVFNYSDGIRISHTTPSEGSEFSANLVGSKINKQVQGCDRFNSHGRPTSQRASELKILSYDLTNRFKQHLDVIRCLIVTPLDEKAFVSYCQSCDLRFDSLNDQVPIRLASGTIIRIWSTILLLNRFSCAVNPGKHREWEEDAHAILNEAVNSMESLFKEAIHFCEHDGISQIKAVFTERMKNRLESITN